MYFLYQLLERLEADCDCGQIFLLADDARDRRYEDKGIGFWIKVKSFTEMSDGTVQCPAAKDESKLQVSENEGLRKVFVSRRS
jgi:hypothetical protein